MALPLTILLLHIQQSSPELANNYWIRLPMRWQRPGRHCVRLISRYRTLALWRNGWEDHGCPPFLFTDDCLLNQFDLEFHNPACANSPWLLPVCFYTPVNAFTSAMVEQEAMIDRESGSSQPCRDRIARSLGHINVDMTVDLEPLSLPMIKLCDLQVGDVLSIPHPGKSYIRVQNALLFCGTTGQHGGHLTVQINECLTGEDGQ